MPTVRIVVRYDGTGLCGWQRQKDGVPTVQQWLEECASAMAGEPVVVRGAGRTDAGVHAIAQVAAFRTTRTIPMHGWKLGLTTRLPPQIAVIDAREVPDGYDPRRVSGGKRYRYLLQTSRIRDPLVRDRAWHVYDALDLGAMREACGALLGTHDFAGFRAADCQGTTSVRTIFHAAWTPAWRGSTDLVAFEIEGTAFLKNMVRILVGTMVDVGRGRQPVSIVRDVLAHRDRTRAGITAPPHGLYLDEVFIRPEHRLDDDVLNLRPDRTGIAIDERADATGDEADEGD